MKLLLRILVNRLSFLSIIFIVQLVVLILVILEFSEYFSYFYILSTTFSMLMVFYLVNQSINPAFKIAWIIPILIFPIFGGILYLFFGTTRIRHSFRTIIEQIMEKQVHESLSTEPIIPIENPIIHYQSNYIKQVSDYPLYQRTETLYLESGEVLFEHLIKEIKKAKHYIFLEYFIIQEGLMWDKILNLLIEKQANGVDVRIIYDDFGCLKTLPYRYYQKLRNLGIKCSVFNPIIPILTPTHNHRDHRKIVVIDGVTGFTGGVNLADEYINKRVRYGHWKDSGILIKGEAVWSFTVMFLSLWNALNKISDDLSRYKPNPIEYKNFTNDGFVQPYADNPLDDELVGESIYLNLINKAQKYIYITTPYLIISNEMAFALSYAAKSGIDVRMITPGIPDKIYVHEVSRSFYPFLIRSGVKIYEYTPGFIHSKTFVVDDEFAVVGSVNLDFRSLYLHFECGTCLYHTVSVHQIKSDFFKTIDRSHEISYDESIHISWYRSLYRFVIRVFAPLM